MTTHQHQQAQQEEQTIHDQRNKDIDLYGYAGAFRRGSKDMSYIEYKWMKDNNMLEGENCNE